MLFELDLTIQQFDPADFPGGLQPFEVNFLTLYLTADANNPLCQPSGGWPGCKTLAEVVPSDVDDLEAEPLPDFSPSQVDLDAPVVAFVGQLGPIGPAADGDVFTLMPQFFDAYAAAVARFGPQNLIVGLSASFASNCLPPSEDRSDEVCVELSHIVTRNTPEPSTVVLLAASLAAVLGRRRGAVTTAPKSRPNCLAR